MIDKMYKNEKLLDAERLYSYENASLMDKATPYGEQLDSEFPLPESFSNIFDEIVASINSKTPKCSIKLPNEVLKQLFDFIKWEKSNNRSGTWSTWKTGYNSSLLPYLDLSEFDFRGMKIEKANLSGHSEILTHAVARKKGINQVLFDSCSCSGVNLNGVDLSCTKIGAYNCDLRNTGIGQNIGDENGIIRYPYDYCNLEGEDLSGKYYLARNKGGNFKNTGLMVDFKSFFNVYKQYWDKRLLNLVEDCNFIGCKIAAIERQDIDSLCRYSRLGFPGTYIEYNGRVYYGTEQILALFESVIQDIALEYVYDKSIQKKLVK